MSADTSVRHTPHVPPVPQLVRIGFGRHATSGLSYERLSFTFTHEFPSSDFWFSGTLLTVGTGQVIPKPSAGGTATEWLGISFTVAQAHTASGTSSVLSRPTRPIGGERVVTYVQAGDFEGGLNYGVLVTWSSAHSDRLIRVVEVETLSSSGQHLFTVAFDLDNTRRS